MDALSTTANNPTGPPNNPARLPPSRHRKRLSLRLSTDSAATLPEYTSPRLKQTSIQRHNLQQHSSWVDLPSDQPPDYSDSADEADQSDSSSPEVYLPPIRPTPPVSPGPRRRSAQSSRRTSYGHVHTHSDPHLDALLARSVHALEMSNALLQTSISTQSSLSTLLASDDTPAELALEARARGLSRRIRNAKDAHTGWVEIEQDMDELFGEMSQASRAKVDVDLPVSQSLPTASNIPPELGARSARPGPQPLSATIAPENAHLNFSNHNRKDFVAPPPRALTIYVNSSDDPNAITLPSTLGTRSPPAVFSNQPTMLRPGARPYMHTFASTSSLPDRPSDTSATKAQNILSSFVDRSPSPSTSFFSFRRNSSSSSTKSAPTTGTNTRRHSTLTHSPSPVREEVASTSTSSSETRTSRSRSVTPKRPDTAGLHQLPRIMTSIEELSSRSSSSSDDQQPSVERTLQSLRKIMDAHPPPQPVTPPEPPRPKFMPRTPAPVAASGTSSATASVSRLLTKNVHHSSTRARSPPRHSSMKRRPVDGERPSSEPATPSVLSPPPTPNTFTPGHSPHPSTSGAGLLLAVTSLVPGVVRARSASHGDASKSPIASASASTSASGRSTPKRISFAELPESYAHSKPGGPTIKKAARKKGKGKGKGKSGSGDGEEGGGWWTSWLLGAASTGGGGGGGAGFSVGPGREERIEERIAGRGWTGRPGAGSLDDWAV